ncbi:UbiA family prenyltransferase [Massilia cavernae]|nr:UbiA family prenyltransferase [Massilia cavernae]
MEHDKSQLAPVPPLVVDLDGTLIHSDLLWEALVLFIRTRFLHLWRLPLWLFKGKAGFKRELAAAVCPNPATLPYDRTLLALLAEERKTGRLLVLATGSERSFAERIAAHLDLFDHVHATDAGINLTSHNKACHLVDTYGDKGFDYIGNAGADRAVWLRSRNAFSVTARPFRLDDGRATEQMGAVRAGWGMALLKAMRPRQWLKNLLVFLPMLAGHAINADTALQSLLAFVAFSLCASSAYLLNDALDAGDDRIHPTKRKRPIAAGTLPLPVAMFASPLLAACALALCAAFNPLLLAAVGLYFAATLCYSLYLKRLLVIDIVTLAILYSMRILGGAAATGIEPSFWLLAFSFFIFLSLALLKRHSELFNLHRRGKEKAAGRAYTTADKGPIGVMGVNSAFMSVLIFILYFQSQNVQMLYPHPAWLAGIVPLLAFWLGRLWTLSYRGQVNEDPVLYVSRDPVSLVVVALCVALAALASL